MTSKEIRSKFLRYFESNGHTICESSSLVPYDDPSLLFVNAGMVQFKGVFLGIETRPYLRAVSCQKCVRAGGKHNDLENVGKTLRHHTFFEMLGNFSFGDYFKKEAIAYAWEFVTKELDLEKERICITVFKEDEEAEIIWKGMGIPSDRIFKLGEKDNFWSMGDEGPCGPCSEIHYDMGKNVGCRRPNCGVTCDCDRFLEVWNLVFMQWERKKNGEIKPLPKPSIDTGMGLERISAIMQGKIGNYDTDLFSPIIAKVEEISGRRYGQDEETDIAIRVIADHIRGATFIIGDGILPEREGRGYVLRRIIRRAMRYARKIGIDGNFLYSLSGVVVDLMGDIYPEIKQNHPHIAMVIKAEEDRFRETLTFGTKLYEEVSESIKKTGGKIIPGDIVYKLYDTYGFPLDLTMEMAKEDGLELDLEGFNRSLFEQKERSKEIAKAKKETIYRYDYSGIKEPTVFVGYDRLECPAKILMVLKDSIPCEELKEKEEGEIILDGTPFYAEGGGQVHDEGTLKTENGIVKVTHVKRIFQDVIVHRVRVERGFVRKGEIVSAAVDPLRRRDVSRNHTATHLLHYALRTVLGDHVRQKGSLVEKERLRFDFAHYKAIDPHELWKVEEIVNEKIMECEDVKIEIKPKEEAIRSGAIALFEEKYGQIVRVVKIGDFSAELCGGTHVKNTGEIGSFMILSESALASGVRRIEATTGRYALYHSRKDRETMREISSILGVEKQKLMERIQELTTALKEKEKQIETLKEAIVSQRVDEAIKEGYEIDGAKVVSVFVEDGEVEFLRKVSDMIRERSKNAIAIVGTRKEDRGIIVVAVSRGLENRYNAGEIVKKIAEKYGGRGGGSPNLAQGGIPGDRVKNAIKDKTLLESIQMRN